MNLETDKTILEFVNGVVGQVTVPGFCFKN